MNEDEGKYVDSLEDCYDKHKARIKELENALNEVKSIYGKESKHPANAMHLMVNVAIKAMPPKH